jgi:proteasome lid subunit RPN8/RPN11
LDLNRFGATIKNTRLVPRRGDGIVVTITFSFATRQLESKLRQYACTKKHVEIFVACTGDVRGRKGGIDYRICQLIAFPNLASDPEHFGDVPANWESIVNESCKFDGNRFLGFIHSHPGTSSRKSRQDTEFFTSLSKQQGIFIAGIIGTRLTMRVYHVDEDKMTLIDGKSAEFKILTRI